MLPNPAHLSQLDAYIARLMRDTNTPALQVALLDRDRTHYLAAYGYANLESRQPATNDTLFQIGSITKSFTALAVVRAAESGLLDLQAPVTDYLPWFQVQSTHAPITIHHLLTHTAGLVGVIDKSPDVTSAVYALRDTEAAFPPGSHFSYSDAGYQVLTLILEKVHARPFFEVIRAEIFRPLAMTSSHATITHAIRPQLATGYSTLYDDRPHHLSHPLVPSTWIETYSGDCCIVSTAEDMARYVHMLLNRGRAPHTPLVSDAGFDLLSQPHADAGWCRYGYGLMLQEREGLMYIGHGGGMPGFNAQILADPENGLGLVLLSSHRYPPGLPFTLMDAWRAIHRGDTPTFPPDPPDPSTLDNPSQYAGTYRSAGNYDHPLILTATGDHLLLHHDNQQVPLERRGTDSFYIPHPHYDRFLVTFNRGESHINDTTDPQEITSAYHGSQWLIREPHASHIVAFAFPHASAWLAYPGHYRSHNPWQTNFYVVLRAGQLVLLWPNGDADPLTPLPDGTFRVGDELSPERLSFHDILDGQALCATLSTCDYYRFPTP